MKRLFLKAAGVAAVGALLKACGGGGGDPAPQPAPPPAPSPRTTTTLLQLAEQDSRFSTLLAAVNRAGLAGALADVNATLTLFAPTNDAFTALAGRLGLGDANALINALSPTALANILNFHLLPQPRSLANLTDLASTGERPGTLYSFDGEPARLIFIAEGAQLNIWDGVGRTSITITQADVGASNGVLQVVSDVLLPRGVLTVSQMLRANVDYFSEFSSQMTAQVIAELDGPGPFTVFVPLDDAVSGVLSPTVVRHHVVRQLLGAANFPAPNVSVQLTTLINLRTTFTSGSQPPAVKNGRSVLGTLSDRTATRAVVTDVDFYAANGVIHSIDKVLVP